MAEFALHPKDWKTAQWALENKLYQSVFESVSHLEQAVDALARELSTCNPEALAALKTSLWEGTEHWEALLGKRAETSGKLALSDRAQQIILDFKNRA